MSNYVRTIALSSLIVQLPTVIVEQFKEQAAQRNMTIRAAAAEALANWIAKQPEAIE